MSFISRNYERLDGVIFSGSLSALTLVETEDNVNDEGFFYIAKEKKIALFRKSDTVCKITISKCTDEDVVDYMLNTGNVVYRAMSSRNIDKEFVENFYKINNIKQNSTIIIANSEGYWKVSIDTKIVNTNYDDTNKSRIFIK